MTCAKTNVHLVVLFDALFQPECVCVCVFARKVHNFCCPSFLCICCLTTCRQKKSQDSWLREEATSAGSCLYVQVYIWHHAVGFFSPLCYSYGLLVLLQIYMKMSMSTCLSNLSNIGIFYVFMQSLRSPFKLGINSMELNGANIAVNANALVDVHFCSLGFSLLNSARKVFSVI